VYYTVCSGLCGMSTAFMSSMVKCGSSMSSCLTSTGSEVNSYSVYHLGFEPV